MSTVHERSLGQLFSDLSTQASTLVRTEVELARHEMVSKATASVKDSALIAVGGVIAYAGFIVLLLGIAWLLVTLGLAVWLSFVLVGVIVAAVGGVIAYTYLNKLRSISPVPQRTVETVRDDVEWAKEQTR